MQSSVLLAIAATVGALAVPAQAVELVVNGGFESPAVTGAGGYNYRTGMQLTGWTYTGGHNGSVQFDAGYAPGNASVGIGLQSVQIEYPGDSISQVLATDVGQSYQLSFLLSSYGNVASSLLVSVGPAGGAFTGPASSATYVPYALSFVANSTATTLTFTNNGALFTYPHLDGVSVSAVPEPETLALMLAGLGVFGLLGRRRLAASADA